MNHGPLDNTSAFPFENFMTNVKNSIRKPNFVLAQLYNRCAELNLAEISATNKIPIEPKLYKQTNSGKFDRCKMNQTLFSSSLSDCGAKLKDNTFIQILCFSVINENAKKVHYKRLLYVDKIIDDKLVWSPLKHYGLFPCIIDTNEEMCNIHELECKVSLLPWFHLSKQNIFVAIPLLN